MRNPLLEVSQTLPAFSTIKAEHVAPAIRGLLEHNLQQVELLLAKQTEPCWDSLVFPMEALDHRLHEAWSCVGHLNAVMSTPELRDAYNECMPKITEYGSILGQHDGLYAAYQQIAESPAFAELDIAQRKTIMDAIADFKLSGIALDKEARKEFRQISRDLSTLTSQFEDNILDATDAWELLVSREQLQGLPQLSIDAAAQFAQKQGKEGYLLGLNFPCFHAVMTYCEDRSLREQVYTAYVTRASDQGPQAGRWDNSQIMIDILQRRLALAKVLGYANYAERSEQKKMVKDPQQILDFLQDLAARAKPQAERDMQQLRDFAKDAGHAGELMAWDVAFYSERLREDAYHISQEELRAYFPEHKVLDGMFALTEKLYGVRFSEDKDVDVWHEDVRFFQMYDKDGELRAKFYMDLHARPHKRGGAWMDECRQRRRCKDNQLQIPIAFLNCNFMAAEAGKPTLLTHDEVITLFHEFGHGLHHMLTTIDYPEVAGINGVPWDAVELPSQFNEQWAWQAEILPTISAHHETGEPLPQALIDKLLASRNFQSAMQMVRQLEFGLFDMHIYMATDSERIDADFVQKTLDRVRAEVAVVKAPAFNRFQHGFSHIFAGGYAAGYYSYKWAEVLASDAFAKFEEEGLFNPEVGQAFLHSILQRGGSQDPMELFVEFRGREPKIDALLRHCGIEG